MTRKPDDWMPLNIRKYLGDTTHLTRDQHGAYLLLLMAYWMRGGPLPADDARLAATAKATAQEWKKLRPVLKEFFREEDGHWHQKRADEELETARALTETKAEAGRAGGIAARGRSGRKPNSKKIADEIAKPIAEGIADRIAEPIANEWRKNTPSTSNQEPTTSTGTVAAREPLNGEKSQLVTLLGLLKIEANPHKMADASRVFGDLKAKGCTFEHMLRAAEEGARNPSEKRSLRYIEARAIELRDTASPAVEIEYTDPQGWRDRIASSEKNGGTWLAKWGPRIGEPGCLVPPKLFPVKQSTDRMHQP